MTHRLVYYSRNALTGNDDAMKAEVRHILETSRRNNARCGVTGALLFNNGVFAQILEGSAAMLDETFERIQRDDRHVDVTVLDYKAVETPAFPNWSMAFVGASDRSRSLFGTMPTDFDPKRLTADAVFQTLERTVREEEKVGA